MRFLKDLEPSGIQVMTHEKRIYPSKVSNKMFYLTSNDNQVIGSMDFSVPPPGFDPSLPPPTGNKIHPSYYTDALCKFWKTKYNQPTEGSAVRKIKKIV